MIRYLTEKEVILINAAVIKRYTPKEQIGVFNRHMLLSALERPRQSAFGEDAYPTLWDKVASLYASLSQNHAFYNGNKRTGFSSMKQFLWVNGYRFDANQKEVEDYTVFLVVQKPPIEYISDWIKTYVEHR